MVLSSNQEAMDLLRALAAEITDNGAEMGIGCLASKLTLPFG